MPKSSIRTQIGDRKEKRKLDRKLKKGKKNNRLVYKEEESSTTELSAPAAKPAAHLENTNVSKSKKRKSSEAGSDGESKKKKLSDDFYSHLDPETATAMKRDDEEIAILEQNLGIKSGKGKKKLNKEYSKLEGYGDDFVDFLDDMDSLMDRIVQKDGDNDDFIDNFDDNTDSEDEHSKEEDTAEINSEEKSKKLSKINNSSSPDDIYSQLDPETAAAMKRDDEEIAMLERNLGIKSGKGKKKLNKEYSKLEGYGDDFVDFLDDMDSLMDRIHSQDATSTADEYGDRESDLDISDYISERSDSDEEEVLPMKVPETSDAEQADEEDSDTSSDNGEVEFSSDEDNHELSFEQDTYRPVDGQDLYGNQVDPGNDTNTAKKYIPPYLRNQQAQEGVTALAKQLDDDLERKEQLRMLQCLLNKSLNRLSDKTLESVAKSITEIYLSKGYSSNDVNEYFWKNIRVACVASHMIMSSLIPIYTACIAGVHFQTGDSVQVGGHVMERAVIELWDIINKSRTGYNHETPDIHDEQAIMNKDGSNFMLILCYLYNYNVVHCTLMYDILRDMIKSFTELDVELILLILSHCGHQMRLDDPAALKDIVILVQERAFGDSKQEGPIKQASSRAQHMVNAIADLKNNKKSSKDMSIAEKTMSYRRVIGRMKSAMSLGSNNKSAASNSLRVPLQDILNIETNGRWWKIGASWIGNQFRHNDGKDVSNEQQLPKPPSSQMASRKTKINTKREKLLALATKQRMNSDTRRDVFCIIMGSADCQEAFETLVRGGYLKGKIERDVIRVLMHCCGREKVYNPYYAHLADQICDFQNNCKFTIQLTFWDAFKQFDDANMKARKAANLAKLLAHLLIRNRLTLNTLKTIDISPKDMPEQTIIFLTILFTNIFEHFEDSEQVSNLFQRGTRHRSDILEDDNDNIVATDKKEELRDSIMMFLMHFLENSPKNTKGSRFRRGLKAAVKACDSKHASFIDF